MNRLADQTSPYLRQHADNPVDWYPWGDEAFTVAAETDRPVMLSVGYSACHWCHVMAHESFEDPETAALMNELYVNVKVDREERPDVDALYMNAVQAMTGQGGWPMTVFLTPEGRPFFGGTYFPPEERPGMPSFRRVLEAIDEAWRERRADLDEQASRLTAALAEAATPDPAAALPGPDVLAAARAELGRGFEPRYGGFGGAPKFPPAMALRFLLRDHVRTGNEESLDMVRTTLDAMAAGGLRDHVGGGFHRYSVDDTWLVPHFEKMLYDQALIVRAYTQGFQVTGEQRWKIVVEELIEYVLRDLRTDGGGFASAEDADSEGIEGKFYVWSVEELRDVLGDDAQVVIDYFGATPQGNFEGGNILHVADRTRPRPTEVERSLPLLREVRSRRVRPGLDDKVLLAWNALFARALAEAAAVFERDDWLDAARTTVEFLESSLRSAGGRLLRSWQGGHARHHAYAEDYAALLGAQLTLAELDDMAWVERARSDGLASGRSVSRSRQWRLLHEWRRRRRAPGARQGFLRQRDALGQLAGRRRPASPRCPDRREGLGDPRMQRDPRRGRPPRADARGIRRDARSSRARRGGTARDRGDRRSDGSLLRRVAARDRRPTAPGRRHGGRWSRRRFRPAASGPRRRGLASRIRL